VPKLPGKWVQLFRRVVVTWAAPLMHKK